MTLKSFQHYLRRIKSHTENTVDYFRLAFEGNKVERLTNFESIKNPVLLLHGYGGTRRVMSLLEKRLRRDGHSVFSLNLGGIFDTFNTKAIPELAQHVSKKIEKLYRRYSIQDRLTVIGHSKGGLIGRCYVQNFKGHRRVQQLITLGTPHNGNPWCMLILFTPLGLLTESIRQMTPMSPFIRRINRESWPKGVKLISIYSKDDTLCPLPSSVLQESTDVKNVELTDVGHIDFLMKKRVYWVIRRELLAQKASPMPTLLRRKKQKSRSNSRSKAPG